MSIFLGIISLLIAGLAALYAKKSVEEAKRNTAIARKSVKEAERSADIAEASHAVSLEEKLYNSQLDNIEHRRKVIELEQQLTDKENRDKFIAILKKNTGESLYGNGNSYCQKCLSDYKKPIIPIFIDGEQVNGEFKQFLHCYVCGTKYKYKI